MSQKRKSHQELDNCQIRITFGKTREQLLAEAKSEILRHEYWADLAAKILVNWRDKLIRKQWKLGVLEQGMNSPDENKLHFTKNWQIENEHDVILVSLVFKSWKNWREREQEFRLEEFSIRKLVENHFRDVESVRSGQLFHVPGQPALFFLFLVNQEDC